MRGNIPSSQWGVKGSLTDMRSFLTGVTRAICLAGPTKPQDPRKGYVDPGQCEQSSMGPWGSKEAVGVLLGRRMLVGTTQSFAVIRRLTVCSSRLGFADVGFVGIYRSVRSTSPYQVRAGLADALQ